MLSIIDLDIFNHIIDFTANIYLDTKEGGLCCFDLKSPVTFFQC